MRAQFILAEVGIGLRRNLSMTVSVILVTFVSLVFVGAAALLQLQIAKLQDDWLAKVEISVFLCPADSPAVECAPGEVTQDQIVAIEAILDSPELEPIIESVHFSTKEEMYEAFQRRFGNEPWAPMTTVDQMNQVFRIKLADPEQFQVVADVLRGKPGVEEVKDQRDYFQTVFQLLGGLRLLSVGIAVVMLVAAVLLIATTIRLSAYSRRRETGIMRLVGASTLFIQLPFMLEGAIAAVFGAAVAGAALYFGVDTVVGEWIGSGRGLVNAFEVISPADALSVAPVLLVIAVVLAGVSSLVTLSRYTKV